MSTSYLFFAEGGVGYTGAAYFRRFMVLVELVRSEVFRFYFEVDNRFSRFAAKTHGSCTVV